MGLTTQRLREEGNGARPRIAPTSLTYAEHQTKLAELHKQYGAKLQQKNARIAELEAQLARRDERFARRIAELEQPAQAGRASKAKPKKKR